MMTTPAFAYVQQAVDTAPEVEWLNLTSVKPLPQQTEDAARRLDALLPAWATMNPVRRLVRVTIAEEC